MSNTWVAGTDANAGGTFLTYNATSVVPPGAAVMETNDQSVYIGNDIISREMGGSLLQVWSNSSTARLLTHCAQGVEAFRRIGLAISPRSLLVRLSITAAMKYGDPNFPNYSDPEVLVSAPNAGDLLPGAIVNGANVGVYVRTSVRIIVFRLMEPGSLVGETLGWRQLFQTGTNNTPSVQDFLRTDTIGQYAVVNDFTTTLDADSPHKNLSIRIPVSKVLRYGGAEMQNVRSGHYYMMACCEVPVGYVAGASSFIPSVIRYNHRMAYTDA